MVSVENVKAQRYKETEHKRHSFEIKKMTMTLSRVVPVMLYTIMCTTHVRSQSCDADPDSDIKYDRTIGGAGVAPEGTSAFTTNMRGLSVDQASGE